MRDLPFAGATVEVTGSIFQLEAVLPTRSFNAHLSTSNVRATGQSLLDSQTIMLNFELHVLTDIIRAYDCVELRAAVMDSQFGCLTPEYRHVIETGVRQAYLADAWNRAMRSSGIDANGELDQPGGIVCTWLQAQGLDAVRCQNVLANPANRHWVNGERHLGECDYLIFQARRITASGLLAETTGAPHTGPPPPPPP